MATSMRPYRAPLDLLDLKDYKGQRVSKALQESPELMENRDSKAPRETWGTQVCQVKKEDWDFLDCRVPME